MDETKSRTAPRAAAFKEGQGKSRYWIFQEGDELVVLSGPEKPSPPTAMNGKRVKYLASAPDESMRDRFIQRQVNAYGLKVRK
jgi:hypothetical protein